MTKTPEPEAHETAEKQLQITFSFLNDCRAVIGELKTHRANAAKWVITINLALAAAAATAGLETMRAHIFLLSVAVAALGAILYWHYNRRITRVRKRLRKITVHLKNNVWNFNEAWETNFGEKKTATYDNWEMLVFLGAVALSVVPAFLLIPHGQLKALLGCS